MENASKALLIAGSVLIVILLIAVGIRIYNSTTGTSDEIDKTLSQTEITTFNGKFTQYVGNNRTSVEVIALANLIIAHNTSVDDADRKVLLHLYEQSGEGVLCKSEDINDISAGISNLSGNNYVIKDYRYGRDGLIDEMYAYLMPVSSGG